MKYNRFLAILLSALMLLCLCSCIGKGDSSTVTDADTSNDISITDNSAQNNPDIDFEGKIGLILHNDGNDSFDNTLISTLERIKSEFKIDIVKKENVTVKDCFDISAALADDGCSLIIAGYYGYEEQIIKAAVEHTDVQFCVLGGKRAKTEQLPNYHNAYVSMYEAWYLSGVVAGMKLNEMISTGVVEEKNANLGFIGSFTDTFTVSSYSAYFLGVRSVIKNAKMSVYYTGSTHDENKDYAAAKKLIDQGCTLIAQYSQSMGVAKKCAESKIPFVSMINDYSAEYYDTFLVSQNIDWYVYLAHIIKSISDSGNFETDWTGSIADGSVNCSTPNEKISVDNTADRIKAIKSDLTDGRLSVFDTDMFTVGGIKLDSYEADVLPDELDSEDTEVIKDGIFLEQYYRSAPYFELRIDGITVLNEKYEIIN